MAKMPWMKFFVGDWLKDTARFTFELQGFWMRLICYMHENDRRGYLCEANGQPLPLDQLARMTGCSTDDAAHLTQQLISSGVASVTAEGVLFNRRMVKEAQVSAINSDNGKRGGRGRKRNKSEPESEMKAAIWPLVSGSSRHEEIPPDWEGGVGEGGCISAAIDVAQRFSFICKRRVRDGLPFYKPDGTSCEAEAEELLRHVPKEAIFREIVRPGRDRAEWFREMAKRLMPVVSKFSPPEQVYDTEAELQRKIKESSERAARHSKGEQ